MSVLNSSAFELNIVSMTDVHGHYISEPEKNTYGVDRLSSFIKTLRTQKENVLLIDNGDTIHGHHIVDLFDYNDHEFSNLQHPLTITHQHLQTDAFVLGNHEFNFGIQHLNQIQKESSIPWLAGNIATINSNKNPYHTSHIFNFNGIKVGLLGYITSYVPYWENQKHIPNLEFQDVLTCLKKDLVKIKNECDILIVAYHGGLEQKLNKTTLPPKVTSENVGFRIRQQFPEIDVLITGHLHEEILHIPENPNEMAVIQAGCFANSWGIIQIKGERNNTEFKITEKSGELFSSKDFEPDLELQDKLKPHIEVIQKKLNVDLGTASNQFQIQDPLHDVWLKKHSLTQWINSLMMEHSGAKIAASALLTPHLVGLPNQVKLTHILENYPYLNTLCKIKITGKILKQALEKAASFFQYDNDEIVVHHEWKQKKIRSYDYDIWDGIEYEFDIKQPMGKRLSWVYFEGKEISDTEFFEVAVTSYRAGGAFYRMFSHDQIVWEEPTPINELMRIDLLKQKHLSIQPKQNFHIR
ncbi:MAG: 2',3'-cyclic-nucleotide 2'-phosphodiesterase/3'-nucleotidase [bacterium]|jgi:2',3'-cyclic-nucleotide 2'-phosphodiesterase/3'-nucleotidase